MITVQDVGNAPITTNGNTANLRHLLITTDLAHSIYGLTTGSTFSEFRFLGRNSKPSGRGNSFPFHFREQRSNLTKSL